MVTGILLFLSQATGVSIPGLFSSSPPQVANSSHSNGVRTEHTAQKQKKVGWMIAETDILYDLLSAIRKAAKLNGVDPTMSYQTNAVASLLASYSKARTQGELERDPVCDVAFV
jgi:hypothetical protein